MKHKRLLIPILGIIAATSLYGGKELKAESSVKSDNTAVSIVTLNSTGSQQLISVNPQILHTQLMDTRNGTMVQASGVDVLSTLDFLPANRIETVGASGKTSIIFVFDNSYRDRKPSLTTQYRVNLPFTSNKPAGLIHGTLTITTKDKKGIQADWSTIRYDVQRFLNSQNGGTAILYTELIATSMGTKTSGTAKGLGGAASAALVESITAGIAPALSAASTVSRVEPIISATFIIL